MTGDATIQLAAVVTGTHAIAGGILSNLVLDRQRLKQQERSLALSFRGEITAILEVVKERNYVNRFTQVAEQIERTHEPFFAPFRLALVRPGAQENVGQLGLLKSPLPEELPLFYTRLASVMEDIASMGDGHILTP